MTWKRLYTAIMSTPDMTEYAFIDILVILSSCVFAQKQVR